MRVTAPIARRIARHRSRWWPVLALFHCACGVRYWVCDEVAPQRLARLPTRLSQTALFDDIAEQSLAAGVLAYRPEFELWSDGADKRRWLWLPPGSRIDTEDMDAWQFPEGTKLWKEFSRAGVRIETRLLTRQGPSPTDWIAASYLWSADQRDALLAPAGASNALGTEHDVPAASACMGCHGGRKSRVLGVAALQLGQPARPGEVGLAELDQRGLLSVSPLQTMTIPGNEAQRAALGYLYANCSHCHNRSRPEQSGARCYDPRNELDFSLSVHTLASVQQSGVYRTGIDDAFTPGEPDRSELVKRMSNRDFGSQMPPLASERVDERGVALMRAWIASP